MFHPPKVKGSVQLYSMTDFTDKNQLRRYFTAVRKNVGSADKDKKIAERLLSEELIKNADILLIYASFGSEINTWTIAERILQSNITLAYPLCGNNSEMSFHIVSSADQLRSGKYGICEPDASLPVPSLTERSVCIIPGLAFTENGGRLGYGGGYYDRFLAAHKKIHKAALSYEKLIVPELPLMPHDIRTDIIVTEERTVFCNAE